MADPRELLKDSWARMDSEEQEELHALVMGLWRETLSASKGKTVKGVYECLKCSHRNLVEVPVEVPDIATRAKAFSIFADQAFGKLPETRRVEADVSVTHISELSSLSMAELGRLSGRYAEVVEGEFVEVGPAPELPPAAA